MSERGGFLFALQEGEVELGGMRGLVEVVDELGVWERREIGKEVRGGG